MEVLKCGSILPVNSILDHQTFRPIHYLGSKLRLLETIESTLDRIDPCRGPVIDLFSGSGVVSAHLSRTRQVMAVDIQAYSQVLTRAILGSSAKIPNEIVEQVTSGSEHSYIQTAMASLVSIEDRAFSEYRHGNSDLLLGLLELGPLFQYSSGMRRVPVGPVGVALGETLRELKKLPHSGLLVTCLYYAGVYFGFRQAIDIDACLLYIRTSEADYVGQFHAAVLSSASEIVNTVGKHFAQPVTPLDRDGKPKVSILNKVCRDRTLSFVLALEGWVHQYNSIPESRYPGVVVRADFESALELAQDFKTVYADPPYTRYHYSRYYHVLETLALLDVPKISASNISSRFTLSKGVYRDDRFVSDFSINSKAVAEFERLFAATSKRRLDLVLSYSPYSSSDAVTPRVLTIDKLLQLGKQYYKNVEWFSCGDFSHSKLNSKSMNLDASDEAEVLMTMQH
jgi:16S rRNA G966 N2-methylase RsmD